MSHGRKAFRLTVQAIYVHDKYLTMKIVLITGGSSGIGFELSKCFANAGYHILWVALDEVELKGAKVALQTNYPGTPIHFLPMDLSQPQAAQEVYDWVQAEQWKVDVLVNNAGFGTYGFANDIDLQKEVDMIQLNVLSVFKLTRLFLKDMLLKDSGTIINISSNTSFQPVPKMAAYASTKSFVKHYSESLAEEMKTLKTAVRVMTVCPAAIKNTQFKSAAKMDKVKTFDGLVATTKEEVAYDIWKGFINGKSFVASGARLRLLMWLIPILPHALVQFLLRDELSESK